MRLIVDIEDIDKKLLDKDLCGDARTEAILFAVKDGIPFDSVIDDIKEEAFKQSKQTNERFSPDWNEGFNDGMFHTLTIIRECFEHIGENDND